MIHTPRVAVARIVSNLTECPCWYFLSHGPKHPNDKHPCGICYGSADRILDAIALAEATGGSE